MSAIQSHRKESFEVVIIGGGVIGLSIARALASRDIRDILLIERSSLGTEASFAAAGMLAPQAEADSIDDFFHLACRSRDMYHDFASSLLEETGVDVELDTTGTLYLALTGHDQEEIERRYEWQSRAGLPVERLTTTEALEIEPSINPSVVSALKFPLDVQVENRRLLSALANSIRKRGIAFRTETNVDSLLIERGNVKGIATSGGPIECSKVIVAAGPWTTFIDFRMEQTGKTKSAPSIEPVRGQMVCLEARPQIARHVIYSPRGYLVPRRDSRLLAGSTSEKAGFSKQTTAGGIATILRNALEISPAVSSLPVVDSWAGLRPRASDGLPVLGPCGEIGGLFYATGHYRNGILLAPLTAELIAQSVVDGFLPPSVAPFSPNRFALVTT